MAHELGHRRHRHVAQAFESAFGQLTKSNLPDPAPPLIAYLWLFGHPTVPERVEAARRAAGSTTVRA